MSNEVVLKDNSAEVIKKIAEATEAGLTACAMQVHGQAVLLTPKVTTRLVHSLTYKVGKFKSQMGPRTMPEDEFQSEPAEGEAIIGTNVFYAAGVELGNPPHDIPNAFGWGITVHHPGNPPKSFLRRALEEVGESKINSIFKKEYDRIMK